MGRIAKILSFLRTTINGATVTEITVDVGGGQNITASHYGPIGDDSPPLSTDFAATIPGGRSGEQLVVGYLDPINSPKGQAGDKRIVARDKGTGLVAVEIWLKNDGSTTIENSSGFIKLDASGNINLNGVIIDTNGNITGAGTISSLGSLKVNNLELKTHTHSQANDSDGNTEQNTGEPI